MVGEIDPQEVIANLSLEVIRGQLKKLTAKVDLAVGHLEAVSSAQEELLTLVQALNEKEKKSDA